VVIGEQRGRIDLEHDRILGVATAHFPGVFDAPGQVDLLA